MLVFEFCILSDFTEIEALRFYMGKEYIDLHQDRYEQIYRVGAHLMINAR